MLESEQRMGPVVRKPGVREGVRKGSPLLGGWGWKAQGVGMRSVLAPAFFLDGDRKEGSQMRCLLPTPCEVSFPASKQALTSNTFLFRGPALPPSWPASATALTHGGKGRLVPRRGPSGPFPQAFTVAGWAQDRMRTGVLSGLSGGP